MNEHNERMSNVCCGCKGKKDIGCAVCWDCFKGRNGRTAFKYWMGSLASWLKEAVLVKAPAGWDYV